MDWKKQNVLFASKKLSQAEEERQALQALLDEANLGLTASYEVNEGMPSWVVADVGNRNSNLALGTAAGQIRVRPLGHLGSGPDIEVLPADLPAVVEWILGGGPEKMASWDQMGIAVDDAIGRARSEGLDERLSRFQQRWGRESFVLELGAWRAEFRNDELGRAAAAAWAEEASSRVSC